jgi:hypothetical protein
LKGGLAFSIGHTDVRAKHHYSVYLMKGGIEIKIKTLLIVSACVLALFTEPARAIPITREVLIDLEADGRVIAFSGADAWEGTVGIEDTSFSTGDTYLFKIRFANSKGLQLSNPGTNPLNDGFQLTKLSLLFETPSRIDYNASGLFTYVGVGGDLISNPTPWGVGGVGGAFRGPFTNLNLTDTSFWYSGIDIEITLDSFVCTQGPCVFNQLEWSSTSEDVQIVDAAPVPESSTILLIGTGLVGLLGFGRKKLLKK